MTYDWWQVEWWWHDILMFTDIKIQYLGWNTSNYSFSMEIAEVLSYFNFGNQVLFIALYHQKIQYLCYKQRMDSQS